MTSTMYYRLHPGARRRKAKTDKAINARPEQIKKRSQSNQKRREAKAKGQNIRGKDYDHAVDRFISIKKNRGRKGEGNR